MFQGFNTDNPVNIASLICGFVIIFTGVYLLDSIARKDYHQISQRDNDGIEEDEAFLMGEATLLEEHDDSSVNISGLNHDDSDSDIELVMRPRSG